MSSILVTGLKGGVGRTTVAEALRFVADKEGFVVDVLDGHARLNCDLRKKAAGADLALIVVEAGVFGQLDIGFLAAEMLKDNTRCAVLVNKAREEADLSLLDLLKELNIPYAGSIPFNRYFAYELSEGKVLSEEDQKTYKLMQDVLALAAATEV